jgi:DnaJ-class molecular chaperone
MLCDFCGGTGSILGFGAMRITCPQCNGDRIVADKISDELLPVEPDSRDNLLRKRGLQSDKKHGR